MGFALYHLPGQSKKQPKKQPDKAADLAKLGEAQKEKKHGILYICGNCGQQVELKPSDHVRCRHCGHRTVLYTFFLAMMLKLLQLLHENF